MDAISRILADAQNVNRGFNAAAQRNDSAGWDGAGAIYGSSGGYGNRAGGIEGGQGYQTFTRGDPMTNLIGDIMAGGRNAAGCPPEGFAPRQQPGESVGYKPFEAYGARRFPLGGFRRNVTAALPTATITNAPQIPFRGERLIVPSNIGVDFDIVDVKVGNQSEFVAAGSIPALVFSEQGFDCGLRADTAYIAMTIAILVQNLAALDKDFAAAIIGTAVKGN